MTRDEMIEKMAHAFVRSLLQQEDEGGMLAPYVDECEGLDSITIDGRVNIIAAMREAVSDIESAGLAIVPIEATDIMVMRALESSMRIMDQAGVDRLLPNEEGGRPSIVARSAYRAMVEDGRVK